MGNIGNIISTVGSALGAVNPLLSLGGSILGGLFGSKGQSNANKQNLLIARETNAANRANQEYQNAWNLEMWNKQNAYNDPAAQRSRLEAAGLNPIFSGIDGTGNAGSLTSADYTATPGAPMANSGEFMANGIMNAAKTMAEVDLLNSQANKVDEETEGQKIYNRIQSATEGTTIALAGANLEVTQEMKNKLKQDQSESVARINKLENDIRQVDEQIALATKEYDLEKWKAEVDKELRETKLDNDYKIALKHIAVEWFNAKQNARMVNLNILNSQVLRENIRANTGKVRAESKNMDIQNEWQSTINDSNVKALHAQTRNNNANASFGSGTAGTVLRFINLCSGSYNSLLY